MKVVMGICERVVVINFGQKLCEGPPRVVQADPAVCAAYLGRGLSMLLEVDELRVTYGPAQALKGFRYVWTTAKWSP